MSREKLLRRVEELIKLSKRSPKNPKTYIEELRELGNRVISDEECKRLAKFFRALADETRLKILALLAEKGEMCVCEVMAALNLPQPTTSYHLSVLKEAGLVKDKREGRWVFYKITDKKLVNRLLGINPL